MPETPQITLLISGSRDWPYPGVIRTAMSDVRMERPTSRIVLIHGACPTGADAIADSYGRERKFDIARFPAQWEIYGKHAGPLRNSKMVQALARSFNPRFFAFLYENSRGTRGTLEMVQRMNLPWHLYTATRKRPGEVTYTNWRGRHEILLAEFSPASRSVIAE